MNAPDLSPTTGELKIAVFTFCWNEAPLLPYFLRHYHWAEAIVIYDHYSDDGSREIAAAWPKVEVRPFGTRDIYDELTMLSVKNHCWKELRSKGYDYACVVDLDEFLYAPDLAEQLRKYRSDGTTVIQPRGFDMISEAFPRADGPITDQVSRGVHSPRFSKPCLIQPDEISEINYVPGAHECRPKGRVQMASPESIRLLHMRYLGFDYLLDRNRRQAQRRSPANLKHQWGVHLEKTAQTLREQFEALRSAAVIVT